MRDVTEIALRRGFIFPSAEIYGGCAGFYDYGPLGFMLKKKLQNFWEEFFVRSEGAYQIETSTILPEIVLKASGHVDHFADPLTQCLKCKTMHRADQIILEAIGKFAEGLSVKDLTDVIRKENVRCPKCKGELSEVRIFNLMFKTNIGAVDGNSGYTRPETAQGIFINFKRIFKSMRAKLPFSIAQIGRSYRNEISPRRGIMRVREFTQMEIECFVSEENLNNHPVYEDFKNKKIRILSRDAQRKEDGKAEEMKIEDALKKILPNQYMAFYLVKELEFYQKLGIPRKCMRFRHMLPEETPHYSGGNFDLEIKYSFGWREVVGNAYRGDYDLKTHIKKSRQNLYYDLEGEKIIPHVIEPSFGVERTIQAIFEHCYREDEVRNWFSFNPKISPYIVSVFPLVRKNGLPEIAENIFEDLRFKFDALYDEKGSIGKRYRRQDEIGTPFCITIDYQTKEDKTVTLRERDSMEQVRIGIDEIEKKIRELI